MYMVVNGVWFFRMGLMSWLLLNGGPAGFDPKTFTGPFQTALAILTYAVPIQVVGYFPKFHITSRTISEDIQLPIH
jgi:hypothetical protein